ncbi:FAD binding domain-containing protein [Pseudomassariella vexata]|uniref:Fumarate reductase n=1 Tax=Pseudomassariella vexata TaxID=1141098 RepID=A0A1Y2DNY4_9PEZI|nr:FAD binding domain-containing protein [Pseudomassariella vexata]ORY60993.1 FAD binding domain-containing protein [Pseudomassariella vexata]
MFPRRTPYYFLSILILGAAVLMLNRFPVCNNTLKGIFQSTSQRVFHTSNLITPSLFQMSSKPTVLVIGSGLAGLSAAHEALKAGSRVHMFEREAKPGGNSIKASSGINGAGTEYQATIAVSDSPDIFYDDTVRSAGARFQEPGPKGLDRKALVGVLTKQSAGALEWLTKEVGVDLSVVAQLGGHSVARTHRGAGQTPPGAAIVTALLKSLGESPDFTLSTSTEVKSLVVEDGAVVGVRYLVTSDGASSEEQELQGPVVFAAGGFAGDAQGLLAKYRSDLKGMPSTNTARPSAHRLLEEADVGVEFVDMSEVQVHPTGFVDPKDAAAGYKFLAAEALRGEGGIMLSAKGDRFVNEMERRDVVSAAIMALPPMELEGDAKQWDVTLLLDPGACEAVAGHLGFYTWKGLMQKKKVRELAPEVIAAVDKYAQVVAKGKDDEFGRKAFGRWRLPAGEANRDEEVCVGKVTPVTHFTMGGVVFNKDAQVLGKKNDETVPVKGLWAAGEITGGIHGANRLGGSSLLECAVFGRIAGAGVAKAVAKR